jgi:hypothetical protein
MIITLKRPIRAKVVTYRLDEVYGSLHTQQLHGFDEFRNDQGAVQNRCAKVDTAVVSLYLPASNFSFRIPRLAKNNRANGKWRNQVFFFYDSRRSDLS